MMMASDLSRREGMIRAEDHERAVALIRRAGLPDKAPEGMTPADFMELMAVDKKNVDGGLRLVLMRALGDAFVTGDSKPDNLHQTLLEFVR